MDTEDRKGVTFEDLPFGDEGEGALSDQDDDIIDLVDVVDEDALSERSYIDEALERKIIEAAERIAREMFPAIAERIIREEIEKLKE